MKLTVQLFGFIISLIGIIGGCIAVGIKLWDSVSLNMIDFMFMALIGMVILGMSEMEALNGKDSKT